MLDGYSVLATTREPALATSVFNEGLKSFAVVPGEHNFLLPNQASTLPQPFQELVDPWDRRHFLERVEGLRPSLKSVQGIIITAIFSSLALSLCVSTSTTDVLFPFLLFAYYTFCLHTRFLTLPPSAQHFLTTPKRKSSAANADTSFASDNLSVLHVDEPSLRTARLFLKFFSVAISLECFYLLFSRFSNKKFGASSTDLAVTDGLRTIVASVPTICRVSRLSLSVSSVSSILM